MELTEDINSRIKSIYDATGMTQRDFAKSIGITEAYMSKIIRNEPVNPSRRVLQMIAIIHNANLTWLTTGEGQPFNVPPIPEAKRPKLLPILGKVPAGFPDQVPEEIEGYIAIPDAPDNAYVLRVKGNSMSPEIKDGDFVVFVPDGDIKSGDVVVVLNEWGESMVKKYMVKDGEPWLVSLNPEYPSFKINQQYRLIGKVVNAWSKRSF